MHQVYGHYAQPEQALCGLNGFPLEGGYYGQTYGSRSWSEPAVSVARGSHPCKRTGGFRRKTDALDEGCNNGKEVRWVWTFGNRCSPSCFTVSC